MAKIITGIITITICQFIFLQNFLHADEVYLKNKDRITGKIIKEDEQVLVIETEAMGSISVKKELVERVSFDEKIEVVEKEQKQPITWDREISLGYNKSSGNTQNSQFSMRLFVHRKTDQDEFHLKGDNFYSSSDKKMNAQQWNGVIRYAYSFWERKWYNFYKLESNHDRFANIDYRIIPSAGLGYWFSDEADWKAMTEVALGLEYTNYRDTTKDDSGGVLIPRAFFEKKLFGESKISQDITCYPSLGNVGEVRVHSETALTSPLSEKLSLRLSFIDDYNSDPPQNIKKNDLKFISSLNFSF